MITFLRAVAWLTIVFWVLVGIANIVIRRDPLQMLRLALDNKEPRMPLWLGLAGIVAVLFLWNVH